MGSDSDGYMPFGSLATYDIMFSRQYNGPGSTLDILTVLTVRRISKKFLYSRYGSSSEKRANKERRKKLQYSSTIVVETGRMFPRSVGGFKT